MVITKPIVDTIAILVANFDEIRRLTRIAIIRTTNEEEYCNELFHGVSIQNVMRKPSLFATLSFTHIHARIYM